MADFILVPALISGAVIGIYEAISLIKDVDVPYKRFTHASQALIFALLATFASFNVEFVLALIPAIKTIPLVSNPIVFRILIGVITAVRVHGMSRATKSGSGVTGLSETWFHTFFVGGLCAGAPYLYPLLAPVLPKYLR
jgi:hypothetical protein